MYSGESQQNLCLANYRPPCLHLRAFHSTTGKQFWHEEIPIQLSSPVGVLVVSDGVLSLSDWNGSVVAIEAKTRRIRRHYHGQWEHLTKLDVLGGIILPHTYKNTLPALHTPTGQGFWTKQGQDNEDDFWCLVAGKAISLAAHQRKPSTPSPGRVYALDSQTGSVLWQKHFPSALVSVWAATDEMVYAAYSPGASFTGMQHVLDERSGSTTWAMQLVSGKCSPVAVRGNVLYLVVTLHLLALDQSTGELLWSYEHEPTQDHPRSQMITLLENREHLLTSQRACESEHESYDSSLYRLSALDRATGKLLRVVKGGHVCEGHPPTFFTISRAEGDHLWPHTSPWEEKRPNLFAHAQAGWQRTLVNMALLR